MTEAPAAQLAGALRDLLARSVATQRAELEADLAAIPAQVAELSRRLVALDRRLPAAARRLEALRGMADLEAFAEAELGRVLAVPGVQGVEADGTALVVSTEPIRVHWDGVDRDLGAYRILLDLAGDVRVESVDRLGPRPAWGHPHVQENLPCLGNLREGVLKLVAEYELALATQVLLDFLRSYQPETAYTPIEGWPVAGRRSVRATSPGDQPAAWRAGAEAEAR